MDGRPASWGSQTSKLEIIAATESQYRRAHKLARNSETVRQWDFNISEVLEQQKICPLETRDKPLDHFFQQNWLEKRAYTQGYNLASLTRRQIPNSGFGLRKDSKLKSFAALPWRAWPHFAVALEFQSSPFLPGRHR